jgi:hypothetical protein
VALALSTCILFVAVAWLEQQRWHLSHLATPLLLSAATATLGGGALSFFYLFPGAAAVASSCAGRFD